MNQKTKLIIFGIGGLLFFLIAVFVVLITRYEPVQEFDMTSDRIIGATSDGKGPQLVQNTKNVENFNTQAIMPTSYQCTFTNKDGTCVLSSDIQTDELEDITEPFLDISTVTVTEEKRGITTFSQELFSPIPLEQSDLAYFFLVDTDNNSETGGDPATLGIPTTFKGAELIASIVVSTLKIEGSQRLVADPILWKFINGTFVKQKTNPDVHARIGAVKLTADSFDGKTNSTVHSSDTIVLELPNAMRGIVSVPFRIQALSKQGNKVDSLKESGVEIDWTPIEFPLCSVEPSPAMIGDSVVVRANGLVPNHDVVVDFETDPVVSGTTDEKGNATVQFIIPDSASQGNNNISVVSKGTALLATCGVQVSQSKISTKAKTEPQKEYAKICSDSDNGKNFFTKGTATGIVRCIIGGKATDCPGGIVSRTDVCTIGSPQINGSTAYVHEYFCDEDGRTAIELGPCPNGCADGACKK